MFLVLGIIAALIVLAVVIVLILAAGKPDSFRVERQITISAPAAKLFPLVNDLHNWAGWSPFEKLDPAMKKTFSGNSGGVGAVYEWAGNSKAGQGRMEIIDSAPPRKVTIKLDFIKPFEGHNTAEFTFVPQGNATQVTWAVFGPCPFMAKIFHIFVSMDQMMGTMFEEGLGNLKAVAEK